MVPSKSLGPGLPELLPCGKGGKWIFTFILYWHTVHCLL